MNKWLRRALLGGVAMTVMAAGAQADELSALKAQLEALQARVATIESRGAALPEGVSLITFERGQSTIASDELFANNMLDRAPASRGMTIAITPTADLPAPVSSIELSGYVRAVALWHDSDDDTKISDFDFLGRGQIDVKATVDTAIGRVTGGIQLRGDFSTNYTGTDFDVKGNATSAHTYMRTAWATWQMTDALSLTFGHTGQIAALSNVKDPSVFLHYGPDSTRRTQARLTYASGPFNLRFGIEESSQGDIGTNQTTMPDFAGSMGLNMGMFGFRAGGEVGRVRTGSDFKTGWAANAGINMSLGSMGSFEVGGVYTKGLACDGLIKAPGVACFNTGDDSLVKVWGLKAHMGLNVTETTSFHLTGGLFNAKNDDTWDKGWSVGGDLVYRPVDALQFAAEVDYAVRKTTGGAKNKDFAVGVAGWFFF